MMRHHARRCTCCALLRKRPTFPVRPAQGWRAARARPHAGRRQGCAPTGARARGRQAAEYTRQATVDSITIPVGPRLGDVVVEAEGLCKAYGERVLLDNATFSIPPGSVVGAPGRPARGGAPAARRLHGAAGLASQAARQARLRARGAPDERCCQPWDAGVGRWRLAVESAHDVSARTTRCIADRAAPWELSRGMHELL